MTTYDRIRPALLVAMALAGIAIVVFWPQLMDQFSEVPGPYVIRASNVALLAVLALSLNLVFGYTGLLSIMHTGLLILGGYTFAVMTVTYDVPFVVGIVIAIGLTAAFSAFVAFAAQRATYLYFGMITVGFNLLLVEIAEKWSSVTGGETGFRLPFENPTFFGNTLTQDQFYYLLVGVLAVTYVFHRNVVRSRAGRAFQAVRESNDAAMALGINPTTTKVVAFALSGGIAGLAGAFSASLLHFVTPQQGALETSLPLLIGLLLGGVATLVGPILGVAGISYVETALDNGWFADWYQSYRWPIVGVVAAACLVLIPRSIVRREYFDSSYRVWAGVGIAAAVGAVVVLLSGEVEQYLAEYQLWNNLILGVILLVLMVVIPKGIVGSWTSSRLGRPAYEDTGEIEHPAVLEIPLADEQPEVATDTPILEGRDLTKMFGGLAALNGVSIQVMPERVHGLIGPNGSGKSTLVSCLTRFLEPTDGTVYLYGKRSTLRPQQMAAAGVTRVFQVPHLFERVSAMDNVLTGMYLRERQNWLTAALRLPSYRRETREERVEALDLLAAVGLSARAEWPAAALSHGQKRMLEVARALATRPRLLILDEPATGLTREEIAALERVISALRQRGLAVLLIEHNVEFVMETCDTITVLDSGEVICEGTPEVVQASPEVLEAYLGAEDADLPVEELL